MERENANPGTEALPQNPAGQSPENQGLAGPAGWKGIPAARRVPNRRWVVELEGLPKVIPPYCTCCGLPTRETELLEYQPDQKGEKKERRYEKIRLPLCPQCAAHRRSLQRARKGGFWGALLLGLFFPVLASLAIQLPAGWLIYMAWVDLRGTPLFGFDQLILGALAYLALGVLVRFAPLEPRHSTRGRSAWISAQPADSQKLEISFTHPGYARRFAWENGAQAREEGCNNPVEARNLLGYTPRLGLTLFKIVAYMFLIACAGLLVMRPFMG